MRQSHDSRNFQLRAIARFVTGEGPVRRRRESAHASPSNESLLRHAELSPRTCSSPSRRSSRNQRRKRFRSWSRWDAALDQQPVAHLVPKHPPGAALPIVRGMAGHA